MSWAGQVMSSSLTGDQIASFFQHAITFNLVEQQSRKNTTILVIRSFVSKLHTETPVFKKKKKMCHSDEIASRFYFFANKKTKNIS